MYDKTALKKRQNILLAVLKEIDNICKTKGIQYSLTGGSLLGCIRHKGFIPWDDDMDIMVDRSNYKLLREAISENDMFQMVRGPFLQKIEALGVSEEKDNTHFLVDVFILDHLPDNRIKAKLKIICLKFLQGLLKEEPSYKDMSTLYKFLVLITFLLGRLFSRRSKLKMYDAISTWGNSDCAEYISITNDGFRLLNIKHKANLLDSYEYLKFEDTYFMCVSHYDDYLKVRYGNYMKWPEESKRVPTHENQKIYSI